MPSTRTRLVLSAIVGLVSSVFLTAGSLAASMGGLSTMVPGNWAQRLIAWLMGWAPVRVILGCAATALTFAWILAKPAQTRLDAKTSRAGRSWSWARGSRRHTGPLVGPGEAAPDELVEPGNQGDATPAPSATRPKAWTRGSRRRTHPLVGSDISAAVEPTEANNERDASTGVHPTRPKTWPRVLIFALWSLPLLLIPPVLSRDMVAYADLGWMLNHGHDPYTESMHQLGSPFPIDPKWGDTTTPYPPLSLWIFKYIVQVIGVHPYWNIVAMRIPVVIGIALLVWSLPRVARFIGADPSFAVWFGVLNPIMLIHGVGGGHNDVLMAGVTVAALALATLPLGIVWGSIAAGTAGCIKQVGLAAAVGVAGIVLIKWRRKRPARAERSASWWYHFGSITLLTIAAIALAGASFVGWTAWTGYGYGWTNSPGPLDSATATPSLVMASATYWMINHGWFKDTFKVASTWLVIGRVVAAIIALIEYFRHASRDPIRVVAVITLVWALGYGVLWEWYLLAPLALIGVASAGRRLLGFANWVMWYALATSVVRLVIGSTHLLKVGWISALAASVLYLLVRPHRWARTLVDPTSSSPAVEPDQHSPEEPSDAEPEPQENAYQPVESATGHKETTDPETTKDPQKMTEKRAEA